MHKILVFANSTAMLHKFRKEVLEAMLDCNWNVIISAPQDGFEKDLSQMGCTCVNTSINRHGCNLFQDLALFFNYCGLIYRYRPNVILTYTIKPNLYGNMAARFFQTSVVSTVTGLGNAFYGKGLVNRIVKLLYLISIKHCGCVFVQNRDDMERLCAQKLVHPESCKLVAGSGVNLTEFELYPLPETAPVTFLFVGRILKTKGIEELLYAAKQLHETGADCRIQIAGFFDGDYEETISKAQERGDIEYLGFLHDVRPVMKMCHCVVLPSYSEGMSNALLEAAAMGRPLIASDVSGCREIISERQNGFLCKPGDAQSLYYCMREFLNLEDEKRMEMGKHSRKHVEANFDRTRVVKAYLDQLQQLYDGQVKKQRKEIRKGGKNG